MLRTRPRAAVHLRRLIGVLMAAGMFFGFVAVTATPAQAATTRSWSLSAGVDGDAWGSVTWNSDYKFTANLNIYADSGNAVGVKYCWYHFEEGYWWSLDGCGPLRSNSQVGKTKTWTGITASQSFARIGLVRAEIYVSGVYKNSVALYKD